MNSDTIIKVKKPRKLTTPQILLSKFVDNHAPSSDRKWWAREMKMSVSLVKQYDLEFLLWVIPPYGKKVPSLAYFMADYGKQYLQEQFFNFRKSTTDLTKPTESVVLQQDKIGEDIVITKKPKTLQDFLGLFTPQTR